MTAVKLIFVFIVATLFVANALAASDRSRLFSTPLVNDALELIEGRKYEEALSILRPLVSNHPDQTDILFLIGLAAIEASNRKGIGVESRIAFLDEAITALRSILIDRPDLIRVRLELARAFFLKGEDALSREHFERVLAGVRHPAVVTKINRFLNLIRKRRRWSGFFGFVLAPDSNLNVASDADTIRILRWSFERDADEGPNSGTGAVILGGGEYQHPISERLRLRVGAEIAQRDYEGKELDQTLLSVHVGPLWLSQANSEFSLLGIARRQWSSGESYNSEAGVHFVIEHRFARRLTTRGRVSWHQRTFPHKSELDGPRSSISFGSTWLPTSTVRTDASVGYAREQPDSLRWRNSSRWVQLDVSFTLPNGITLGTGSELHWTNYQGDWFPFTLSSTSRDDRLRILRASIFNRAFTMYGFSPKLILVHEVRKSNAQLYDYKRNRAELRFTHQF